MPDRPVTWEEIDERFRASKELTETKFNAALEALRIASEASDRRFDTVNEFRASLSDQRSTFVQISDFNNIVEKVNLMGNQVTVITSKLSSVTSGPAFLIGSMTVMTMVVLAIIGGAIQLGSLQTHVSITSEDVAYLKRDETNRIVEHAAENVERGNFQTRQTLAEDRLKQLEANGYIKPPDISLVLARLAVLEMKNNGK